MAFLGACGPAPRHTQARRRKAQVKCPFQVMVLFYLRWGPWGCNTSGSDQGFAFRWMLVVGSAFFIGSERTLNQVKCKPVSRVTLIATARGQWQCTLVSHFASAHRLRFTVATRKTANGKAGESKPATDVYARHLPLFNQPPRVQSPCPVEGRHLVVKGAASLLSLHMTGLAAPGDTAELPRLSSGI